MRPAIDIRWSIHGRIKEYAEENNLELSEAYEDVLEAGLEEIENPE